MNKEIFLKHLQEALNGNVIPSVINENIQYYETYILQEIRKGRTEEDVLRELGNPRILARTIIDTAEIDVNNHGALGDEYVSFEDGYHNNYENDKCSSGDRDNKGNWHKRRYHNKKYSYSTGNDRHGRITEWKVKLVFGVTILAVLLVIIGIIAMVAGIISFIAPILIPLLMVIILVRVFLRNR